ncbi:MAG: PqqD family protein, partial [Clostridia bacterium]|nr:PqqD family protein [Clostridia bacterium]
AAETEKELLDAILAEYDVTEDVAQKDLSAFLDKLRELGII